MKRGSELIGDEPNPIIMNSISPDNIRNQSSKSL